MMATIHSEIHSLSPTALVELFELDLTSQGGGIERFHAGTNKLNSDVVWRGNVYTRIPIEAKGFAQSGQGSLPRPIVSVSNVGGTLAREAKMYNYFLGCKFTRIRTFARFLDAANFPDGNQEADPNQCLPEEIWYIDRKSSESPNTIEFELASALDMHGVQLPRRQFIQNCCAWAYRSSECGYAGSACADEYGNATTDIARDSCGKRLSDCKLRFGKNAVLPYGGFPGCGLTSA